MRGSPHRHGYISVAAFICEAISGFLSGFYFTLMIYRQAIKKPFTAVLRALQEYGGDIPATAAGEGGGRC